MDPVNRIIEQIIDVLWSTPTFVVLLGVGILFSIWSKFIQVRALTHGVQVLRGKYDDPKDPGAISHFQALSAALSGTVGLGNIGGVALAISIGGPGALFWMWMTGFFGMAIKAVEVTLAMLYRYTSDPENPHGGAMWVITRGFGDRYGGGVLVFSRIVGAIFCVTLLISTFTGGNMFQAWNVANITNTYFGVPQIVSGLVLASLTALVIIGGIKRIGDVAGKLVPFMCGLYLLAGIVVLLVQAAHVPRLLWMIVEEAFSPTSAQGAFLGASWWFGLTIGLRRALFSNEAGQGTSPIAHAAAKTHEPVREGVVAGLEPFIDTCLVCTLTALVILSTGTWNRDAAGEFQGPIAIVQKDGAWTLDASSDVAHLPALAPPDSWQPGNRFFLLAEGGAIDKNTQSRRFKITGRIASDHQSSEKQIIIWDVPEKWERLADAQLIDRGVYRDFVGASLTGHAFDRAIPGLGMWLVTIACWLFAVSTLISWNYYGEQGTIYLFGLRVVPVYKVLYCTATVVATIPAFIRTDEQLGNFSDLGTGFMLFANVPIMLLMGHHAIAAFRDYFRRLDAGAMQPARNSE